MIEDMIILNEVVNSNSGLTSTSVLCNTQILMSVDDNGK